MKCVLAVSSDFVVCIREGVRGKVKTRHSDCIKVKVPFGEEAP